MELLYFYLIFSYSFIYGVYEANYEIGFKASKVTYILAPITMPMLIGKFLSKKFR